MTPSDWIAIGALFVAAASIFFSYLTNKENIKAKRAEIAIEKSIEAFREMLEMLLKFKNEIVSENFELAIKTAHECQGMLNKYALYFPKTIAVDIGYILIRLFRLANTHTHNVEGGLTEDERKIFDTANEHLTVLFLRMQNHIGIETREQQLDKG